MNLRTREPDLEEIFSQYGQLERVTVVYDHRVSFFIIYIIRLYKCFVNLSFFQLLLFFFFFQHKRSRGFGFVYYTSQEDATRAREATNGMVSCLDRV